MGSRGSRDVSSSAPAAAAPIAVAHDLYAAPLTAETLTPVLTGALPSIPKELCCIVADYAEVPPPTWARDPPRYFCVDDCADATKHGYDRKSEAAAAAAAAAGAATWPGATVESLNGEGWVYVLSEQSIALMPDRWALRVNADLNRLTFKFGMCALTPAQLTVRLKSLRNGCLARVRCGSCI
jgi:hypothetical protein